MAQKTVRKKKVKKNVAKGIAHIHSHLTTPSLPSLMNSVMQLHGVVLVH